MPGAKYEDKGPLDCTVKVDLEQVRGRSAVVTGGSMGIGKAYVEALVNAGAFVTVGDINEREGSKLVEEFPGKVEFCKCDVTSWDDQVELFERAISKSPRKSCDIVIANAGVSGVDDVFQLDDASGPPIKPDLRIVNINLIGVLYTIKLATHYFRKSPVDDVHDRCLILQGSLAGYVDQPGSPQYAASKYGVRGIMRSLRRTVWMQDMRINFIGPWFIKTPIMSEAVVERLTRLGVEFALVEDAAKAILRISTDKSVNGRALAIVPRGITPEGFFDLARDDYPKSDHMSEWQAEVLRVSHRVAESEARTAG